MKYDPQSGKCSVFRENTKLRERLEFDREGRLYACEGGATIDARRVVRYEKSGGVTVLADSFEGKRLNIPNDLALDPDGRVWFTDPYYEGAAARGASIARTKSSITTRCIVWIRNGRQLFDPPRDVRHDRPERSAVHAGLQDALRRPEAGGSG
jgi:sugar lactone lactonase YvrE